MKMGRLPHISTITRTPGIAVAAPTLTPSIANLNLAPCYSCEEFNGLLDRGLLIGNKTGFFFP